MRGMQILTVALVLGAALPAAAEQEIGGRSR